MKKELIYRVIVLVLVCTLVLGLTGFTTASPATENYEQQTEEVTPTETVAVPTATPTVTPTPVPTPTAAPTAEPEELGIESAEVVENADEWTRSKTVTVKTTGAVASVVIKDGDSTLATLEGNETGEYKFTFGGEEGNIDTELNADGKTFTVVATEKTAAPAASETEEGDGTGTEATEPATATAEVKVAKVDYTAPVITNVYTDKSRGSTTYKIYASDDNGSGIAGVYCKSATLRTAEKKTDKDGNVYYEYTCSSIVNIVDYKVVDNAGNVCLWSQTGDSVNEISLSVDKGNYVEDEEGGNYWWAGKDATLKIVIKPDDPSGECKVSYKADGSDEFTSLTRNGDYYLIKGSGVYKATIGNSAEEITVKYDPNAPVIESATYEEGPVDAKGIKGFIHKISGGMLFNECFKITIAANDHENDPEVKGEVPTDVSEIATYEYAIFDADGSIADVKEWYTVGVSNAEGITATEEVNENNKKTGNIIFTITDESFTGKIAIRVTDKAGNQTLGTVEFSTTDETTNGELVVTNESAYSAYDNGAYLSVMATTPKYTKNEGTGYKSYDENSETEEVPYNSDKDGWVKEVSLFVDSKLLESGEAPENPKDGDTYTTYNSESKEIVVEYVEYENDAGDTVKSTVTGDKISIPAVFGADDFKYDGNITVKLQCKKIVNTYTTGDDGTGSWSEKESDDPVVLASVSVPVKIQNYLNAPTVVYAVNNSTETSNAEAGTEYGWYNAQDNQIAGLTINGCADSLAPYTVHYSIACEDYATGEKTTVSEEKYFDEDNAKEEISNDLKSKGAGIYTVKVWAEDEAGNSVGVDEYIFKVDESQPTITAIYKEEKAPATALYYNMQRVITVIVQDESFKGDSEEADTFKANVTATEQNSAKASSESKWEHEDEIQIDSNGTRLKNVWVKTFIYGVDPTGKDDGNGYELTVSAQDVAGNKVWTDRNGSMYYSTEAEKGVVAYKNFDISKDSGATGFNIDRTKPVVSVSFDNNNVRNGKYFAAGRTATITVVEHNFYEDGVDMTTVKGKTGESGWTSSGNDTYVKTVTFANDANCEFSIKVTDKAGNVTENSEVNYGSSVAHDSFVIDKTAPQISTTGTSPSPFADSCTPGISGTDTNMSDGQYSCEYNVRLTRTVRESKNEDVTELLSRGGVSIGANTISQVYGNIPADAENDGIYTLTASVTDLAGNTAETSTTFTVNRNGSFYVFNEALSEVVKAGYVQKADGTYKVTEYNASPLVSGSVKVVIYRDGEIISTDKPAVNSAIGSSGLYEYTYTLAADNFAKDGFYRVVISSEDEAQNQSENDKIEESVLEFTVDSVAPEITMIKGMEKDIVNRQQLDVEASTADTYGIRNIKIVVDGKIVKEFVTEDAYEKLSDADKDDHEYVVIDDNMDFTADFTLAESNNRQSVEIVVTDLAGNVTTTASDGFEPVFDFHDNILVSTNFFARFIHNPIAIACTVLGIAIVAGLIWFLVGKKKKSAAET